MRSFRGRRPDRAAPQGRDGASRRGWAQERSAAESADRPPDARARDIPALASYPGMDDQIRAGQGPDHDTIADLVSGRAMQLGDRGVMRERARLQTEMIGLGPLDGLSRERGVTDLLVNGDGEVWVDRGGGGLERSPDHDLANAEAVRRYAVRLAGVAGRRLDDSQPWVDGLLPGSVRLHAILPPLASDGACVSLRLLRQVQVRLADLERGGMCSPEQTEQLRALVRDKVAFVVTGGTGAGKTTLLSAMLAEVDPCERILVVEDVLEMPLSRGHVVRLQARPPNVEGKGLVTMVDLVRQALRMRPDRLVVGEVRGAEVRELLQALNTGHEGGCATLHANSPADVLARFEALGALADLSREAVHAQVATAIRMVVHVSRRPSGRVVDSISALRVP